MKKQATEQHFSANNNKLLNEITKGLQHLDDVQQSSVPNELYFEQLIEITKDTMKQKLIRELFFFLLTSVCILVLTLFFILNSPLVYLFLQGIIVVTLPIGLYFIHKKDKQVDYDAS